MSEDVYDGSDVEVLRTIELRLFRGTSWLGDARPLQELAANHPGVLNRRLVNRNHVVRQTIRNDKSPTFVQWIRCVLQHKYKILQYYHGLLQSESSKSEF